MLNVTFVGITVVFLGLIALAIIVYAYPKLINLFLNKNKKGEKTEPETQEETVVEIASDEEDSEELIAVLTAAIAASMGADYASKIRVSSFRRVNKKSPVWNASGRQESLN